MSHLLLYAAANLLASVATAAQAGWRLLPALPIVFLTVHLAWGTGFLAGALYWPFQRHD